MEEENKFVEFSDVSTAHSAPFKCWFNRDHIIRFCADQKKGTWLYLSDRSVVRVSETVDLVVCNLNSQV